MINYLYSLGKNILKTADISMLLSLKDFFFSVKRLHLWLRKQKLIFPGDMVKVVNPVD